MPIGKNAIKRVENNGYSNVKTEAPDMINSTVIAGTSKEVIEMVEKSVNKAKNSTKKAVEVKVEPATEPAVEVKPTAKKTTAKKSTTPKKPAVKKEEKPTVNFVRFGDDMPIYLL